MRDQPVGPIAGAAQYRAGVRRPYRRSPQPGVPRLHARGHAHPGMGARAAGGPQDPAAADRGLRPGKVVGAPQDRRHPDGDAHGFPHHDAVPEAVSGRDGVAAVADERADRAWSRTLRSRSRHHVSRPRDARGAAPLRPLRGELLPPRARRACHRHAGAGELAGGRRPAAVPAVTGDAEPAAARQHLPERGRLAEDGDRYGLRGGAVLPRALGRVVHDRAALVFLPDQRLAGHEGHSARRAAREQYDGASDRGAAPAAAARGSADRGRAGRRYRGRAEEVRAVSRQPSGDRSPQKETSAEGPALDHCRTDRTTRTPEIRRSSWRWRRC